MQHTPCSSRLAFLAAFFLVSLGALHAAAPVERIPLEAFFGNATVSQYRISPDGRNLAFLADMQNRIGIAVMDLATGKVDKLVRSEEDIESFVWKGNDHVLYFADVGGNEAAAVQSISLSTRRIVRIIESFGKNNEGRQGGQRGYVESIWRTNPEKIIIYGTRDKKARYGSMYEVSISTGRRSALGGYTDEEDAVFNHIFDQQGRIRARLRHTFEGIVFEARLREEGNFTTLVRYPRDIQLAEAPLATVLADHQTLLCVDYSEHDSGALVAWDLNTGRKAETRFVPPTGEISSLILSNDRRELLGVRYSADKTHTHWFDAGMRAIQANLDGAFPENTNLILDWSDDLQRFVIVSSSDREPGLYFLLDKTRGKPLLMALGSSRPSLPGQHLAKVEVVRYPARDGLEIQGYLTRPKGQTTPGPLILIPHGGPYGIRDMWGYDAEVQFLANRGYTVLQVNYRGSGGFGRKFLEAGRLEWGKKMQDDLTDAVKWAITQGYADPQRVCIYGASYGGYAALAGVTFTPELYKCAVNYVGVSDLTYLGREDGASRIRLDIFHNAWIHPDMEELRRRSPANYVANIRVPTLHAYGENDPRVDIRHWKRLKAELDKHKKPYEYLREGDEGHGFSNAEARIRFYTRLEQFLGKNL